MTSTPAHRLRLTPSNSPYLNVPAPPKSPHRGRYHLDPRLSLKKVVGTTCASPTGFDAARSSFAYIAGGAVVVVDVAGDNHRQRFYRARPTAIPVYSTTGHSHSQSNPTSTPKANDSRNRVPIQPRESYGAGDWGDSPSSKTWTSRERIKAATCVALSRDGRYLAVGETGYAPRVLIFNLDDRSSDRPLVSISEHHHGVTAVAWSPDTKFLASLGAANDGFIYVWKIDGRTGAAKLFQQNRCTSYVREMIWMGSNLITLGVRHVKAWRVEEPHVSSPTKQKFGDVGQSFQLQKTLPGRNTLLGELIDATFSCAVALNNTRAIVCSENGDVCLLEDTPKQMKLTKILEIGFGTTCIAIRDQVVHVGGKSGDFATLDLQLLLRGDADCVLTTSRSPVGLAAVGFLRDHLVTVDHERSIDIWSASHSPGREDPDIKRTNIPGYGDAMHGVGAFTQPNACKAAFYTWSKAGKIVIWDADGRTKESFGVSLEEAHLENESDHSNQLTVAKPTREAKYFVTGDRLGILKIIDYKTKKCVLETKAHESDCHTVNIYEDDTRFLIATCGRDRTAQLFHRTSTGDFELFQTLEFPAKVTQVLIPSPDRVLTCSLDRSLQIHELVSKDGVPDIRAAIQLRTVPLKASPTSMTVTADGRSVIVSLLDRSICIYDIETGRLLKTFKCIDESGVESVVLDSLVHRPAKESEPAFLFGLSNTDKSIRIYDATTGAFLDREWGHTESISGVALVQETEDDDKVVSVGSDGTIMIWSLDLRVRASESASRETSPPKDAPAASRAPLRRVLSKAELAEFQKPLPIRPSSSASNGRQSPAPPRSLSKRRSLYNLNSTPAATRTPVAQRQMSPFASVDEDTPTRRPSGSSRCGSPPPSPKSRLGRRPSLPTLKPGKSKSISNLKAFGSLNMATEQTCRMLRTYRKKLDSGDPISEQMLAELDQELRLTSLALGDRAKQSKELGVQMLNSLLDQYSSRLITLLDERLALTGETLDEVMEREESVSISPGGSPGRQNRPGSSGAGSTTTTSSNYSR